MGSSYHSWFYREAMQHVIFIFVPWPRMTPRRCPAVALSKVLRSYEVYGPSVNLPALEHIFIHEGARESAQYWKIVLKCLATKHKSISLSRMKSSCELRGPDYRKWKTWVTKKILPLLFVFENTKKIHNATKIMKAKKGPISGLKHSLYTLF